MAEEIFDYILKNFEAIYKIRHREFNINYGIDEKSKIQIKKGNVNYFTRNEPYDIYGVIWKEWKGDKIPFLFDTESSEIIITQSENQIIIHYDIIASAFYLLSNWQEYISHEKDAYGRFKMTESIQSKLNFICKPVVNYYFDILKDALERAYNIELNQRLWEGKKIAVCLTHDIDLCESAWIQGSFRELLKGNIFTPLKLAMRKLFKRINGSNFRQIMTEKILMSIPRFFSCPSKAGKTEYLMQIIIFQNQNLKRHSA